tara:strand:+ start:4254 stop:5462 length:1209 start_codon:yes stop_codon:yes gene_type:complete
MIFKTLFFLVLNFSLMIKMLNSQEKFEGLIVSVESEIITTYDLSQRIQLALKSLNLEDSINNRDTVRERVLELLILEKIKKLEAVKNNLDHTDEELIEFASVIYNFPKSDFKNFKSFLGEEGIDIDVLMEQISSELLWKKYLQKIVSSKIRISDQEIQKSFDQRTQNKGKYEYDFSEVLFLNETPSNWKKSEKRLKEFLVLLDKGISFKNLSNKFSEAYKMENLDSQWVLEDNLEKETKKNLEKLKIGEISNFKTADGFKLLKLNNKRFFGSSKFKYTFLKISTFTSETLNNISIDNFSCNIPFENKNSDVTAVKFEEILLEEMNEQYKNNLENLNRNGLSKIIEIGNEFVMLKLCDRKVDETQRLTKEDIEKQIYSKKFNQIANTLISNLRKNTNIKYFNK